MEMFLMILFTSLPVMIFSALALKGAASPRSEKPVPERKIEASKPQFFADPLGSPAGPSRFPREFVLSQIERHVRLEQAAAEDFLSVPTAEGLHSPTSSPLLN
jgi:hypothetical protein